MFTGEDAEVRFEDWLPSLQQTADWNGWSAGEQLTQLAGHLRGRAWQEWLLLEEEEKATFTRAIQVLKEALGPGSKILAAQDFRHTTQEETESVSSFVRRLERTFRAAYGADKLSAETRTAFLYGQLQEGLQYNLMNSPNVSGALTYKELVMAAKNEERRQSELKRGDSIRIHQNQQPVVLPQLKLVKLVPVPISLNLQTWGVTSSFATFASSQDTGNVTATNILSLKALAVAHTSANPLILLMKLVLRLCKPHPLPILKRSPRYRILCPCSICHPTRVKAFVQSGLRMRVVAPTMPKS